MPKHESGAVGAPCWIELQTSDPAKSRSFYGELFGWTIEDAGEEYGGYADFLKDGQHVAGCMRNAVPSSTPDGWSVYLATGDAAATASAAEAHGGRVLTPATDVYELGRTAVVADPGGAAIGAWQPGTHPGFTVVAEPGAPAWFELHARDYEATVAFYRDVFGQDTEVASATPEFRYTTLGTGEDAVAGIMDAAAMLPEGTPAHWSVYLAVEDTDAALTKVVQLGGSVVQPAEDSPYGRIAEVADPTGARVKLVAG